MTRQQFLNLPEAEKNIFISKLLHVIRNDDDAFREASFIVTAGQLTGMLKNVKFGGEEVYQEEARSEYY
jgi:hypothetical protein